MILQRLLFVLLVIFFFGKNNAQNSVKENEAIITSRNFKHVKDTVAYDNEARDLLMTIHRKTGVVSIDEINKFIELGIQLDYHKGLGKAHDIAARIYRERSEYPMAIKNYKKAILYFKKINFEKAIAIVHNELYITEKLLGNLEKSAYYLLEAKNYFEKVQDSISLIVMYNNLGTIHLSLKDYSYSEEAFLKAISLKKKLGDLDQIGSILNNLASVYVRDKKLKKAEIAAQESLMYNKKDSISDIAAQSYSIFGEISIEKKEYNKARKYYDSAYYIYNQANDRYMVIGSQQRLGSIELELGNIKKAEKLLKMSRDSYIELDLKDNLLKNYRLSAKLDSVRGNLKGALAWQHKYQELSDKIASDLSTKQIEKRERFYESELEQLRTIDEQEIREQRNNEELFRYRVFTLIILGILSISLLFALWIIRTRKERKKLISKLNESNQVKNKLFSIISHDLKNEIHGLESSLNLMQDNEITTDEFEEIVPLLADRTNQTSILLNNLLNWSKSQMKALKANPVAFDVSEVISTKFIFFKPKANKKNINLINKLDKTHVYADKDMVAIVSQNLIANAIKFCKSGDSITLLSNEKDGYYEIGFSDTGVGIDPKNINKLFAQETFTTHGTENESGTGLGLRICKELIELNKGTIRVESKLGEGSTFYVRLPKATKE